MFPSTRLLVGLAGFLALTANVSALGINCRGSAKCTAFNPGHLTAREAEILMWFINGANDDRWYNDGEHIACTDAQICAFLQKTNGAAGKDLKVLARHIVDHKCTICGSVPIFFPERNDVNEGMLTFNFVSNPACENGLCNETYI